jgi:hypothetical protein
VVAGAFIPQERGMVQDPIHLVGESICLVVFETEMSEPSDTFDLGPIDSHGQSFSNAA